MKADIVLVRVLQETLIRHSLPATTVQLIESPDRNLVSDLMRLDSYVDMLIPRGGASLQRRCQEESRIPIILGGIGVCHIFVGCQCAARAGSYCP